MKGQPASQQSNKNMTDRPTQHHGLEALRDGLGTILFNIHHPSQAIPQTHTGQRQAYNNQIHTKPNPVPKPDLGLNVRTCKQINQQQTQSQ
ncbi:hypothetical protein YC2023_066282 [Brassica napus]